MVARCVYAPARPPHHRIAELEYVVVRVARDALSARAAALWLVVIVIDDHSATVSTRASNDWLVAVPNGEQQRDSVKANNKHTTLPFIVSGL